MPRVKPTWQFDHITEVFDDMALMMWQIIDVSLCRSWWYVVAGGLLRFVVRLGHCEPWIGSMGLRFCACARYVIFTCITRGRLTSCTIARAISKRRRRNQHLSWAPGACQRFLGWLLLQYFSYLTPYMLVFLDSDLDHVLIINVVIEHYFILHKLNNKVKVFFHK